MLMRKPDCQAPAERERDESTEVYSSREMLFGQIYVMLVLAIAILLRSLASAS